MDDGVYTSCWNKKGEDPMGASPFYFSINLFLHQLAIATFLDLCIAQAARLVDFILRIAALEEEDLTMPRRQECGYRFGRGTSGRG